jgi:hypothetical protein
VRPMESPARRKVTTRWRASAAAATATPEGSARSVQGEKVGIPNLAMAAVPVTARRCSLAGGGLTPTMPQGMGACPGGARGSELEAGSSLESEKESGDSGSESGPHVTARPPSAVTLEGFIRADAPRWQEDGSGKG